MNHGEGWQFIQLGKYMERSCALPVLLDAISPEPEKRILGLRGIAGELRGF